jgi:DNA repair photolyase
MRRFSGHLQDPWGSFVDVKVNLLEVLAKELPKRPGGSIWISSVCDPYEQVEAKYKLTRGAIQLISTYPKFTISILTKNSLVLRDIDLLADMKNRVDVGFTITTFSREAQQVFEPHASPVKERIETVKRLNEAGVNAWVFIAPMLPCVTEIGLEDGLRRLKDAGVRSLATDRYNARGSIITQTLEAYKSWDSNCDLEEIRQLLWHGNEYYQALGKRISDTWRSVNPGATYERDLDYATKKTSKKSHPTLSLARNQTQLSLSRLSSTVPEIQSCGSVTISQQGWKHNILSQSKQPV